MLRDLFDLMAVGKLLEEVERSAHLADGDDEDALHLDRLDGDDEDALHLDHLDGDDDEDALHLDHLGEDDEDVLHLSHPDRNYQDAS
jgi:hypothetical protein